MTDTVAAPLTVYINRRRLAVGHRRLTGAQIAALLNVPADNAVVERWDARGELEALALDDEVDLRPGDSFLVTRQFVMGG